MSQRRNRFRSQNNLIKRLVRGIFAFCFFFLSNKLRQSLRPNLSSFLPVDKCCEGNLKSGKTSSILCIALAGSNVALYSSSNRKGPRTDAGCHVVEPPFLKNLNITIPAVATRAAAKPATSQLDVIPSEFGPQRCLGGEKKKKKHEKSGAHVLFFHVSRYGIVNQPFIYPSLASVKSLFRFSLTNLKFSVNVCSFFKFSFSRNKIRRRISNRTADIL